MKKSYNICKILIPIDFSNTSKLAVEHAAHICEKFGSTSLHLLHVLKDSSVDVLPNLKSGVLKGRGEEVRNAIAEELSLIGSEFKEKYNMDCEVEIREGNIAKEITKSASKVKADLIVMGTHGVSGYQEFFLGSNAFRVVTASNVPVLTVQCHAHKVGFNNIVLPIDGSKSSREKVSQAAAIAKAYDATVHIAGLVTKKYRKKEAIFNVKIKQVEEFLSKKGIKHTRRMIHGKDLADMTINFAKEMDACLTVIMTEQEESSGLFMGPYAQRIVNHSEVPILNITPKKMAEKFSQYMSYHTY